MRPRSRRGETTVFQSDDVESGVMSADLPAGTFLLDVREDDEWAAGHAPEAVHVRLSELTARTDEIPRDREVYVICRTGSRSAYATHALTGAGWKAVNVVDGMTGWAVAGRPMVSETGAEPYVA
jgi:rhodanese-related sulfurtransferase